MTVAERAPTTDATAEVRRKPAGHGDVSLYMRLLRDARYAWRFVALIFLIDLAAMPLALLTPLPLKIVVDNVLGTQTVTGILRPIAAGPDAALLVFAAVLLVVVVGLTRLQTMASLLLGTYTAEHLTVDFRARLFKHLQRLSLSYHDRAGTSDSVYRMQYDAPAISWIAVHGVTPFIASALTVIAMVYVTAMIDPQLALIAITVVPVLVFLARSSRHGLRRRWRTVMSLESSSLSVVEEVMGNIRVVKGFGQEQREHRRFLDASSVGLTARLKASGVEGAIGFLVSLTTAIGTALVLFVGALHVEAGLLSLGDLILVIGYMALLYTPLETITRSVATVQASLTSAERAYAVLDQPHDVPSRPGAASLRRAAGAFRFEAVTFGYEPERPVLRDVTFEVPAGARVGIQGSTGSGKSTLIGMLMRFYDPDAGRILLDGVDLRDIVVEDLRRQFAIVLQEPVLFSRTIGENIAYARPEATTAEVIRAAELANAHEFISNLPGGYGTIVGERGMTLSGGERQRISLARAFLCDAPILVLDEPTSAIDTQTEASIIEAIERLMHGRTTFMVAHRLSTLEGCDIRLEMVDGRVVPVGQDPAREPRPTVPTGSPAMAR